MTRQSTTALAEIIDPIGTAPGCQLTETGLVMPDNLTDAQWEQIGGWLAKISNLTRFAIGDWLNYGCEFDGSTASHPIMKGGEDVE